MSSYFEDLRELQHGIYGTESDFQRSSEVEQHNTRNESMDHGLRRQMRQRRKLAAKHEIDRWRERNEASSVPRSDYEPEDESARTNHSKPHEEASPAVEDVEKQNARPSPAWTRQVLALTDQIELENEFVKKHNGGGPVKDGQGHQQYLATQQHLREVQMHGDQQPPIESRSGIRHGSQQDLQAMEQQHDEQAKENPSPHSSLGSVQKAVAWKEDDPSDEVDGETDDLKQPKGRQRKGKVGHGHVGNEETLASDGIRGMNNVHGAPESDVMQEAKIDQPMFGTESSMRPQEPVAGSLTPVYEAGQDQAQRSKLEKRQQQKAATESRRKQRQARKEEAERQKIIEERRIEAERMNEDRNYWQWMSARQLANPNATVMSLSKEQYLKEAKQKKERDVREARRQKQREEREEQLHKIAKCERQAREIPVRMTGSGSDEGI